LVPASPNWRRFYLGKALPGVIKGDVMSWSVSAKGTPSEVKAQLDQQFSYPLADVHGLADEGERETVRRVQDTIGQCLGTFDPAKVVSVSANGHMGFDSWETKAGIVQTVSVSIQPAAV
jgi:hypothetical protein